MIYWITGKKNAGKTTLAHQMREGFIREGKHVLILDGDEVRDRVNNPGYTDEAREQHIMTIAGFAAIAEGQGITVIIALVSPSQEVRDKARKLFRESLLIYLHEGELWAGTTYDTPTREESYMHHD